MSQRATKSLRVPKPKGLKVNKAHREEARLAGDVDEVELDLDDFVWWRHDVEAARLDVVAAVRAEDVVAGVVHGLDAFWSGGNKPRRHFKRSEWNMLHFVLGEYRWNKERLKSVLSSYYM